MQTGMTRWSPSDVLRDRLDRLFGSPFGDMLGVSPASIEEMSNRRWLPAVDIRETDEELALTVELPGMTRDDVQITLENNTLTISGERKFERDVSKESYHRIEREYGSFARSFTMPANVQTDKVDATFKDGLLTVSLPKVEEAKPRKIAIK